MYRFAEHFKLVAAFVPVDTQTGANAGDWVSLKLFDHVTCCFLKAAGVAGDDPIVKLQQATAVAGTAAKDLLFTDIYVEAGTLTSIGGPTKVTQVAATSYTDATHAEVQALYQIEINAEDLDVENGFDCVQISVADTGVAGAQLGCAFYILGTPRYAGVGTAMPSAIVD